MKLAAIAGSNGKRKKTPSFDRVFHPRKMKLDAKVTKKEKYYAAWALVLIGTADSLQFVKRSLSALNFDSVSLKPLLAALHKREVRLGLVSKVLVINRAL